MKKVMTEGFLNVVEEEWKAIKNRRTRLGLTKEEAEAAPETRLGRMVEPDLIPEAPFDTFGLALSGGGIRSATFQLGFLKTLNTRGILKHADYLSTVSGGGYIGSYVQNRLSQTRDYTTLFPEESLKHFKENGDYLRPGKGVRKAFESFNFYLNTLIQIVLHSLWFLLFFSWVLIIVRSIGKLPLIVPNFVISSLILALSAVLIWYYFFHALRHVSRKLWSAKFLFGITSVLTLLLGLTLWFSTDTDPLTATLFDDLSNLPGVIGLGLAVLLIGLFANPNILSAHRLYRFRLRDAFLRGDETKLHELIETDGAERWTYGPYPLINTTLNLQADPKIPGQKSCDYFLLSPLYCGAKVTGYLPTDRTEYRRMTLATALTISGAAVNPSMGYKSSRLLAFAMTLLNLRLGYWALNPAIFSPASSDPDRSWHQRLSKGLRTVSAWTGERFGYALTLWPYYNLAELFGTMHSRRIRINLSDGGNIENLAAFELLRRKAKLIIASDAGADPDYTFSDLKNLMIRARNELELSIEFDSDQDPQTYLRPTVQTGQSRRHYVIGNIYALGETEETKHWIGYFVYVKTTVTPRRTRLSPEEKSLKEEYYDYKTYHPDFPHESTVDQFFDPAQWQAYETLGEEIGETLFKDFTGEVTLDNLLEYFRRQLNPEVKTENNEP